MPLQDSRTLADMAQPGNPVSMPLAGALRVPMPWPEPLIRLYIASRSDPYALINGYGLFAVMTTQWLEIVVEGSQDGEHGLPYEFKWKPGDRQRRPAFAAPHMPRCAHTSASCGLTVCSSSFSEAIPASWICWCTSPCRRRRATFARLYEHRCADEAALHSQEMW